MFLGIKEDSIVLKEKQNKGNKPINLSPLSDENFYRVAPRHCYIKYQSELCQATSKLTYHKETCTGKTQDP